MADEDQGVDNDQPNDDESREEPQGSQEEKLQVGNREMTKDNLVKSYLELERQFQDNKQDEAAKRREAARGEEPQKPQNEETDAIKQAKEQLKALGVVTQDELDKALVKQSLKAEDQNKLDNLISANPGLERYRSAIEKIGKVDRTKSWEDIIIDEGFQVKDKLQKAKARGVMGQKTFDKGQKSIKSMTDKEYAEWKQKNLAGTTLQKSNLSD